MAMTTFPFNTETPIFIPNEERDAAIALESLRRDDANLESAIQGLLALSIEDNSEPGDNDQVYDFDPNPGAEYTDAFNEYAIANGLWGLPGSEREPTHQEILQMRSNFDDQWYNIPVEGDNDQVYDFDPNPDAEYTDAFNEYAIANGLWGLPGSEREPTHQEILQMRSNFDDQWYNFPDEVLNPTQWEVDDANLEVPVEDSHSEEATETSTPIQNTAYEHFDSNSMFIPSCAECGSEAGENVTLYGCSYDQELYCTGCWDDYRMGSGDEEDPTTWTGIAADFQDFIDDMNLNPERPTANQEYLEAWESYLQTCWHPVSLEYIRVLGEANNWVGVRPGAEPRSIDGGDQC